MHVYLEYVNTIKLHYWSFDVYNSIYLHDFRISQYRTLLFANVQNSEIQSTEFPVNQRLLCEFYHL